MPASQFLCLCVQVDPALGAETLHMCHNTQCGGLPINSPCECGSYFHIRANSSYKAYENSGCCDPRHNDYCPSQVMGDEVPRIERYMCCQACQSERSCTLNNYANSSGYCVPIRHPDFGTVPVPIRLYYETGQNAVTYGGLKCNDFLQEGVCTSCASTFNYTNPCIGFSPPPVHYVVLFIRA